MLWFLLSLPPFVLNSIMSLFTMHTSVSQASHSQKQDVKKGRGEHFLCDPNDRLCPRWPVLPWFYIQRNTVWQPKAIKKEFQSLLESLKALQKGSSSNPTDSYKPLSSFLFLSPEPGILQTCAFFPYTPSSPSSLASSPPASFSAIHYINV